MTKNQKPRSAGFLSLKQWLAGHLPIQLRLGKVRQWLWVLAIAKQLLQRFFTNTVNTG
jgi:hypothetical protein